MRTLILGAALGLYAPGASAEDRVVFDVTGAEGGLAGQLQDISALYKRTTDTSATSADLFAEAQAEYGLLLQALYDLGYFSPVIHVLIDGQEAANIAPLEAPTQITRIDVRVDPGPRFTYAKTALGPLETRTELPEDFAPGKPASTGTLREAVEAGVNGWRRIGFAKAGVATQDLVADHAAATLAADITLDPGPRLRFGPLTITGNSRMRTERVAAIAGLPEGERFSTTELAEATDRLQRTGIFSSVSFSEDETITPPDLLGLSLEVSENKTRRYSFGAELSTDQGMNVGGSWLHRNLWGGGERFEASLGLANITRDLDTLDYILSLGLSRPATPWAGTTAGVLGEFVHSTGPGYVFNVADVGLTFNHVFSQELEANLGLNYAILDGRDDTGHFTYASLEMPVGLIWDRRDNRTDPTRMFRIESEIEPFLGFGDTDNGVKATFDLRGYYPLGFADKKDRLVMAARVQGGGFMGADLFGIPRDELFFSGGGGTVRGQPYQSLGVFVQFADGSVAKVGGTSFLAGSLESRLKINDTFGAVAFVDVGTVSATGILDGDVHAGAGLGLRYATAFGPVRLDVAKPVSGDTGDGVQVYVGLGQAF